jgi:hypothetical protein
MVNEIIFCLTVKHSLIFRKRFTVLKTVNRFLKLNYSFLQIRLISDGQNLIMVGCRNSGGTGIQQHPASEYYRRPNPTTSGHRCRMPADQIPVKYGRNPVGSCHWFNQIWPKWSGSGWIGRSPAGIRPHVLARILQRRPDVTEF